MCNCVGADATIDTQFLVSIPPQEIRGRVSRVRTIYRERVEREKGENFTIRLGRREIFSGTRR